MTDIKTFFLLLLSLSLLDVGSASSIVKNPKSNDKLGREFDVYPFLEGIVEFNIENAIVTIFPEDGDVRDLCSDTSEIQKEIAPVDGTEYKHAMYVKIVAGCFPSEMAHVLAKKNFSVLMVRDKFYPVGIAAQSLWKFGEEFEIPVVQIGANDGEFFQNGTVVNLNAAVSKYRSKEFLGYAIFLDFLFAILCLIQIYLGIDRLMNNLRATKFKLSTSAQVLLMEVFEGLVKISMGILDPFGFFHVLPTAWWRIVVFIGSSVTILTTFLLAFRMHAAIREAENLPRIKIWNYIVIYSIPLAMVAADLYAAIEYGLNKDNAGFWATISGILYAASMTATGFYFAWVKAKVINHLKMLSKNDKRGLRRMGYFLAMSGISMFLTIVSSAIYIISISYIPNGHVLYVSSILSAIFVSVTSILHILALRKYGKDNQEKSAVEHSGTNLLLCCWKRKPKPNEPVALNNYSTKVQVQGHSI